MQPLPSLREWFPAMKQKKDLANVSAVTTVKTVTTQQPLAVISLRDLFPAMKQRKDLANVTAGQLLEVTQKYEVKLQALEKELSMLNAKSAIATTDKESLKKDLRNLLANFQKEQELYKN